MSEQDKTAVILLAEDDADDRLLVEEALSEGQWQGGLRFVQNGEELLDYLLRRGAYAPPAEAPRPALILLDLNLPRKDGREALREIKANVALRRIPVVILTTSAADTDIETLYDLGANSFIAKPAQFDALVQVMKSVRQYWFNTVALPALKHT